MIFLDLYIVIEAYMQWFLRTPSTMSLLGFFIGPIKELQNNLQVDHEKLEYELKFNSQIILFEHYLNDLYDNTERRIYIEDVELDENVHVFTNLEENEDVFLFTNDDDPIDHETFIYTLLESDMYADFIVHVPSEVLPMELQLRKSIEKKKLPSINYTIQEI
jgi:hypothetical protein